MFTTAYASLRVPTIDDLDMRQALIDLATDVQYRTERNAARLAELKRRRGVGVRAGSGASMGSGSVVTVPFTTESWDTDDYFNPASNTIVTLPRGLWMVYAGISMNGNGTLSWSLMTVAGSVYGNIFANQNGTFGGSITTLSWLAGSGIFYTNGETVSLTGVQASTGTGSLSQAAMIIMKLGNV